MCCCMRLCLSVSSALLPVPCSAAHSADTPCWLCPRSMAPSTSVRQRLRLASSPMWPPSAAGCSFTAWRCMGEICCAMSGTAARLSMMGKVSGHLQREFRCRGGWTLTPKCWHGPHNKGSKMACLPAGECQRSFAGQVAPLVAMVPVLEGCTYGRATGSWGQNQ